MNSASDMLSITKKEDDLWFKISGDVDHHAAKEINKRIDTEIFVKRPDTVYLDLSGVDFMDSSGLWMILGRYRLSTELGSRFCVYHPTDPASRIIKLSGCEKMINIIKKKEAK